MTKEASRPTRLRRGAGSTALWRSEAGLTLVETLLTLAILAIVAGAFVFFQSAGVQAFALSKQETDLQQNLQFSLDTVTRELRQAEQVAVLPFASRISYTDRDGRDASFFLDTTSGELRQEVTGDPTPVRVIATGIADLSFVELPGPNPLILVTLTGRQGGRSRTESAAVAVRTP